jgi:Mg2+/Co2+ transporter CorB
MFLKKLKPMGFALADITAAMSVAFLMALAMFSPELALANLDFSGAIASSEAVGIAKGILGLAIVIIVFSDTLPNILKGQITEALKSMAIVLILVGIAVKLKDIVSALVSAVGN